MTENDLPDELSESPPGRYRPPGYASADKRRRAIALFEAGIGYKSSTSRPRRFATGLKPGKAANSALKYRPIFIVTAMPSARKPSRCG